MRLLLLQWLLNIRQGKPQGSRIERGEGAALTENPKAGTTAATVDGVQ
jgi:hypothetical protein